MVRFFSSLATYFGFGELEQSESDRLKAEAAAERLTVVRVTASRHEVQRDVAQANCYYIRVQASTDETGTIQHDLCPVKRIDLEADVFDDSHGVKILVARSGVPLLQGVSIDWKLSRDDREGFAFKRPPITPDLSALDAGDSPPDSGESKL